MPGRPFTVEVAQDTPRSRPTFTVVDPDGEYQQTYSSRKAADAAAERANQRRSKR
ncbi:hypothetical protein [Streptomyces harbinensis]|uniref:hypothetical protein n=1 Tax=Streptomyces harbinensis TaxID=1176198 RepID=UPI0036D147E6